MKVLPFPLNPAVRSQLTANSQLKSGSSAVIAQPQSKLPSPRHLVRSDNQQSQEPNIIEDASPSEEGLSEWIKSQAEPGKRELREAAGENAVEVARQIAKDRGIELPPR